MGRNVPLPHAGDAASGGHPAVLHRPGPRLHAWLRPSCRRVVLPPGNPSPLRRPARRSSSRLGGAAATACHIPACEPHGNHDPLRHTTRHRLRLSTSHVAALLCGPVRRLGNALAYRGNGAVGARLRLPAPRAHRHHGVSRAVRATADVLPVPDARDAHHRLRPADVRRSPARQPPRLRACGARLRPLGVVRRGVRLRERGHATGGAQRLAAEQRPRQPVLHGWAPCCQPASCSSYGVTQTCASA